MPSPKLSTKLFFQVFILLLLVSSCGTDKPALHNSPADSKIGKLKVLPGFQAEHLYSPGENEQGSWVAMTFDNKGRMITSDQYGAIYRIVLPAQGDTAKVDVEKLAVTGFVLRNR